MRLALVVPFWGRADVARLIAEHVADLRRELALIGVELLPVAAVSPEDDEIDELRVALSEWHLVRSPNTPLGAKFNTAYRATRDLRVDGVLGIGSDDFMSLGVVEAAVRGIRAGLDYGGVSDLYVVCAVRRQAIHWTGYTGRRAGEAVGPGRWLSAALLERLHWTPFEPSLGRGLDGSMMARIDGLGDVDTRSGVVPMESSGQIVALMTERNISHWWNDRLSPGAVPLAVSDVTSRIRGGERLARYLAPRVWPRADAPRVALAMIAAAEHERAVDSLLAAVESARDVCDEAVVVLDSRSSTAAAEALERIGVRVVRREWTRDFAAAREAAAAACRAPWLVVLDADEVLFGSQEMFAAIHEADAQGLDGVICEVRCVGDNGPGESGPQVRAYRSAAGTWIYAFHNELTGIERAIACGTVVESHYVGTLAAKLERTIPGLEEAEAEDPTNPRWPMLLARSYEQLGRLVEAKDAARRALDLAPADPRYARSWVHMARATLGLEGTVAAERIIDAGIALHPGMPDLRHMRIALDAAVWFHASRNGGLGYRLAGQESVAYADALPEAAKVLGLPLRFDMAAPSAGT